MTSTPKVGSTFFGLDISQFTARLLSIRRKISKRVLVMEFRPDSLLLAEAELTSLGVRLNHISSFTLPPESLDRGVPAEPLKMAGLIQEFCSEKSIPAHRVSIVLPPELAFQRLLDLPASLTTDEARDYVIDPANGLQIPFPLTQTDFDLFPVWMPVEQQASDKRPYILIAIPEVLVDQIVEMLQAADLELQLLEIGSISQLRNHAADLMTLEPQQVDLVLELLPECSNLMLVSSSGLLGLERLAAIRKLPELAIDNDQREVSMDSGITVEELLFKNESYLPISDLDLRVLVTDLRAYLERFHAKYAVGKIRNVILTGVNSSHPLLADLLSETLGLPVVLSCPTKVKGLAGTSMDDLLLKSGLGRMTGLALGLLPDDLLLTCSLEGDTRNNRAFESQSDAVAIEDLLNSSEAQTGLDISTVETSMVDLQRDDMKNKDQIPDYEPEEEIVIDVVSNTISNPYLATDNAHKDNYIHALKTEDILETRSSENVDQEPKRRSTLDEDQPLTTPLNIKSEPDAGYDQIKNTDDYELRTVNRLSNNTDKSSTPSVNTTLKEHSDEVSAALDDSSCRTDGSSIPEAEWPSISRMKLHDGDNDVDSSTDDESQSNPIASLGKHKDVDTLSTTDQSKTLTTASSNVSSVTSPITTLDGDDQTNCAPNLASSGDLPSNSLDETSDDNEDSIISDDSFVSELGELRLADEE